MKPYELLMLWHRAMILFYFQNPGRQEIHVDKLSRYLEWQDLALRKENKDGK